MHRRYIVTSMKQVAAVLVDFSLPLFRYLDMHICWTIFWGWLFVFVLGFKFYLVLGRRLSS